MDVREREPGDIARLEELIARERDGDQRDRYRIALWAIRGREAEEIADTLGRARRSAQHWAYRYRDGGIEALTPRKPPGNKPFLPVERYEEFRKRIIDGPREGDGVCTLRARDAQRILREEFGVEYRFKSVYDLLHRLGLSCLKPRPRHEKSDPAKMEQFRSETAPFLSAQSRRSWPRAGGPDGSA
jgi:transposase